MAPFACIYTPRNTLKYQGTIIPGRSRSCPTRASPQSSHCSSSSVKARSQSLLACLLSLLSPRILTVAGLNPQSTRWRKSGALTHPADMRFSCATDLTLRSKSEGCSVFPPSSRSPKRSALPDRRGLNDLAACQCAYHRGKSRHHCKW